MVMFVYWTSFLESERFSVNLPSQAPKRGSPVAYNLALMTTITWTNENLHRHVPVLYDTVRMSYNHH